TAIVVMLKTPKQKGRPPGPPFFYLIPSAPLPEGEGPYALALRRVFEASLRALPQRCLLLAAAAGLPSARLATGLPVSLSRRTRFTCPSLRARGASEGW